MNSEGAENREGNDEESASEVENADSDKEYKDLFRHPLKKATNMACTFDEPAKDVVVMLPQYHVLSQNVKTIVIKMATATFLC